MNEQQLRYEALRYTCSHGHEYVLIAPATEFLPVDALDNTCDCKDGKLPGVKLWIAAEESPIVIRQNPE